MFLKFFLSFLFLINSLFAFDSSFGEKRIEYYNGDKLKVINKQYSLITDKNKYSCYLLDNNNSVCVDNKKSFFLNSKMVNGRLSDNYLNIIEIKYKK